MNAPINPAHLEPASGLLPDLDINAYHRSPGISKTGLDRIARSPATYYALTLDPNRPPEKERSGQLEGQLAHCAILEPAEFSKRYAVLPNDAPRRPTDAQWNAKKPSPESQTEMDWWRAWEADNTGRVVISAAQYEVAQRQAESVCRLPDIREALGAGQPEVSAFWRDPETGVLCRCRPDWTHQAGDAGVVLLDVKTCSDASPGDFARQIARKRYDVQAAYYTDGYSLASGRDVLAFVFVAVESDYPYQASAVMLDEMSIESGRAKYRRDLNTYAECIRTGQWPGYSTGIETVSLPNWAIENF
ncbi:PD-(D/E)XK nuclease-like domain-containing protein [Kerstersia gyiorum]|uniref:PD-(D/E)XK nuclease-like domain-containing protein n=1 Tax=Kerstersia gyiorum TaxID=206506 RepID=UPI00209CA380|nr:PD-(D/E)XK nuclease-like domain-containing protein [Kerstersia gyiorum]MCP1679445.1 exodeoxyribonuclease VIII [Kerstersia gyiorum]MCP1823948.1 exodeoxyribonuclease VIII [Kerstersia gyiorum]MCP1827389.1 exodeoxyribonuclease VIII [Kerstersia gyiorum]MCW2448962.1 exodeoxyribonuclease VIII [Kerstersia gyiorum]